VFGREIKRERERETKRSGEGVVVKDAKLGRGERNYISGFEGSQAVPACPSCTRNTYVRN
jgi:hypothetical protein